MDAPTASVTDYIGRQVDLLAFDDMHPSQEVLLTQQLVMPGESGALIAGVQKLAQRFLLELMTELGSLKYLPSRGTPFMIEARQGIWRTPGDVAAAFATARFLVRRNLINEESLTDPDDERYGSAELLSTSLVPGQVTLRIRLVSRAGSSLTVLFPLRINAPGL